MKRKIVLNGGRALIGGLAICMVTGVALAALISFLVLSETIPESTIRASAYLGLLISAFLGAFPVVRGGDTGIAIRVAALGGLYCLLLCGIGILVFDNPVSHLLQNVGCVLAGCGAACATCIRKRGSKPRRNKALR